MKSLFFPFFVVLSVVAQADSYLFPPMHYSALPIREMVTIYEVPSHPVVHSITPLTPLPHVTEKPTEKAIAVPLPLKSLAPIFPKQDFPQAEDEESVTLRGQARSVDEIKDILDSPPSVARGAFEAETISPELIGDSDTEDSELASIFPHAAQKPIQNNASGQGTGATDPLGHAVLLFSTVITTMGLVYMAFVAYDYRQRWLHSMTTQNDRYLGGGAFDMEVEDGYGSSVSLSDGFGLKCRTSV